MLRRSSAEGIQNELPFSPQCVSGSPFQEYPDKYWSKCVSRAIDESSDESGELGELEESSLHISKPNDMCISVPCSSSVSLESFSIARRVLDMNCKNSTSSTLEPQNPIRYVSLNVKFSLCKRPCRPLSDIQTVRRRRQISNIILRMYDVKRT